MRKVQDPMLSGTQNGIPGKKKKKGGGDRPKGKKVGDSDEKEKKEGGARLGEPKKEEGVNIRPGPRVLRAEGLVRTKQSSANHHTKPQNRRSRKTIPKKQNGSSPGFSRPRSKKNVRQGKHKKGRNKEGQRDEGGGNL